MTMKENYVSDNEGHVIETGVIRIYALSKQLNVDSKTILDAIKQLGIWDKGSSLAGLTEEEVELIMDWLNNPDIQEWQAIGKETKHFVGT